MSMTALRSEVSVLVAHENTMILELIGSGLNRQSRFHVAASVTTAQELLEIAKSVDFNVALIGANLADNLLSGLMALRQMRELFPDVKSVVLLDTPDRNLIVEAFRAGTKGIFCPSKSSFKELCRCLDRVHAGQIWANSSELANVLETFAQMAPLRVINESRLQLLTKREEDVVRLLAEGLQNREIARELNLSEHTIKNYLFRIFDKLGVSSRVELVLYAVSSAKQTQIAGIQSYEQEDKEIAMASRLSGYCA